MIFASDNWAGAAPEINEALSGANSGKVSGYGAGELDKRVEERFSEIFETEVAIFYVATGTAANALAIAASAKPGSVTFCHEESHVNTDECGSPEFFSGSRLCPVAGKHGKMDMDALLAAIDRYPVSFLHSGRPGGISITQATEIGTLYTIDEIKAFADVARRHSIPLHMDGARFANAVVSLDASPAELTWKSGVDLLSFGGTKNGCWVAEALICFDPARREEMAFHHKRAGQLFSKSRFVSAQLDAYLANGLWLDLASHANHMTGRLLAAIANSKTVRPAWNPQTNELFVVMQKTTAEKIRARGGVFFEWHVPMADPDLLGEGEELYRLVTSFATTEEEVDQFIACIED